MDFERLLAIFGIREKKAAVYLACLELGSSTVYPIAKQAGVQRTTAYDLLEDLQLAGLVSYRELNGRRRYQVNDPRRLRQILEQQQKEVDASLPSLLAMYKPGKEKPVARFYEGREGIGKIYDDALNAPAIWALGDLGHTAEQYPEFLSFAKKVLSRRIPIRELTRRSTQAMELSRLYAAPRHQLRFLPDEIVLETDNILFGDKVAMVSYGETVHGLVVESKAIASTQKQLFEQLWKVSSEL